MEVKKDGKTLFQIQSLDIMSDNSVFDMFVWATNTPIKSEIIKLLKDEFDDDPNQDYEAMADSCEVYKVYADEIN